MNKIIGLILLGMLVYTGPSCRSIMLKSKGITSPKLESVQSIQSYLAHKIPGTSNPLFIAGDSIKILDLYKMIEGFPSVDFFTRDGHLIDYNHQVSCAGRADEFAAQLAKDITYPVNRKYDLQTIVSKIYPVTGPGTDVMDDSDYILLVYWAKYFGALNNNVFGILHTLQNNKKVRVRVIMVNLDFQASWGLKSPPRVKGL
jgi:hypothetical protein